MSVYIKGIDVPKEGTVIVIDSTGQVWSNEWPTRGYTRIDGAKAVPVPPHGDLIDRDEIKLEWDEDSGTWVYYIYSAPVVIPADKEEER